MSIDFQGIRQSHPIADTVGRYIELKRQGGEYRARCPFHNDGNPSFYVVPKKDKAFCMSCGWHGDVVDFIAEFESVDTVEAARRLNGGELPDERPALPPVTSDEDGEWRAVLPAPDDAPAYDPAQTYNPRRGRVVNWQRSLARCDAYRDADGRTLGYVVRMEIDGQKLTPTVVWARHADGRECWASVKFPNPRPLQGLDALASRPDAPVLVVSGEKCRQAAANTFAGFVAVTWPGGDQNVLRANWQPLHGRRVTIWPDADDSGVDAAQKLAQALYGHAAEVRVIDTTGQPECWDVADAIADGMTRASLIEWIKPRVSAWRPDEPDPEPTKRVNGHHVDIPVEPAVDPPIEGELVDLPRQPTDAAWSITAIWSQCMLEKTDKGLPHANFDNASRLLERHPEFEGVLWYDEFLQRILIAWGGEARPLRDADEDRIHLWMQRTAGIHKMPKQAVQQAINVVAHAHRRNELTEWLDSLAWDGVDRLHTLMHAGFSAERNAYTEAVGRCWLTSMVARAYLPGCKVDTMPVFEGTQGTRKSTALQVLVGERWFTEIHDDIMSKDFFITLQGNLLVEISEMHAFGKAEVERIKGVITCRNDRFRAPYGRIAEDHPRRCVFGGTTNRDDWNRDETGARRFWPIRCLSEIDLGWIAENREQLFAEAVARFRSGQSWWDVPDAAARREQDSRRPVDTWQDPFSIFLTGKSFVTVGDMLARVVGLELAKQSLPEQRRAGTVLRALGWKPVVKREGSKLQRGWEPDRSIVTDYK